MRLLVLFLVASLVRGDQGSHSSLTVPYQELAPTLDKFGIPDAHFSELLFDPKHYQLLVGARDAIFRLSLEGLGLLQKAEWKAEEATRDKCTTKGQSEENCRNYIKVLVQDSNEVMVCGTYAFRPRCSFRDAEDITQVRKDIDGRGKCPHSPQANSTALMTSDGDYYVASSTDFSGSDHAIYRMSQHFTALVRTAQYNSLWLDTPDFVYSFQTDRFIYFVFRENAVEHINCGKTVYSRIARVCKNDQGGKLVLKDNWTTFLKARLNCSIPGDLPFYYDQVQSAFYLQEEEMLYATFTNADNGVIGSAVCSFNMSAINSAFNGPFKVQPHPDSNWQSADDDHAHFQCGGVAEDHLVVNSNKYQMVDKAVRTNVQEGPIFKETGTILTQVTADLVRTKHSSNQHVIFLTTNEGEIRKLRFDPRSKLTCLIEVLQPFQRPTKINSLKFLAKTNSIYITTKQSVVRLKTERCGRFLTESSCLGSADPYCGWNQQERVCTANNNPIDSNWKQNILDCPRLDTPIDGGWSDWSLWSTCHQANLDDRFHTSRPASDEDKCQCRRRLCSSPAPRNGGLDCTGVDIEVTNCTQHGQWTTWSEWSGCSKTCDMGVKQRTRVCGNPEHKFGGRVCVGRDVDTDYCTDLPKCNGQSEIVAVASGQWSPWGEWSKCSAECGQGFKSRKRLCDFRSDCQGCDTEYTECQGRSCSQINNWTPWIKTNDTVGGARYEKRYGLAFDTSGGRQFGNIKEEERFCTRSNKCTSTGKSFGSGSVGEHWSDWSQCTRECGTGYQIRIQECRYGCTGLTVMERPCNTQPCTGKWGCWSQWSKCNSNGKKVRHRECTTFDLATPHDPTGVTCEGGTSIEETPCEVWSEWGECEDGVVTRYRTCDSKECEGSEKDTKPCEESSANSVVVGVVCGFMLGMLVGAGLVYYFMIYRRHLGSNSSPHYVSAKSQNLYVSLPMLDLKHSKHFAPSENGTIRSTSTLRSKASVNSIYNRNGATSDYETATIKRSHSHRNSTLFNGNNTIRADLDSDQLFT